MNRTRRVFLSLLLLAAPAAVQAQFTYTTNNGAITLAEYTGSEDSVVVSNFVNDIGSEAFQNCANLTSVVIPGNVSAIGANAFFSCTNLTNASLSAGLACIGESAFYECTGLASVAIPGSVATIGASAFFSCTKLTNATISNGVASLGNDAFDFCTSLTSVTIPASVTSIGISPFVDCTSLTAITVDKNNSFYSGTNGVLFDKTQSTLIQFPGAVGGCYTIPGSVTSVGDSAFCDCAALTSVTIPGSVASIGDWAFAWCLQLTNATIGNGVTSIGAEAFEECNSLTSVTIPGSVTNIGTYALGYCSALTNATIPASVTSLGDYAFCECANLTGVCFQGNAPAADSTVFSTDSKVKAYYLPGATGWSNTFAGRPAAPWFLPHPVFLNNGPINGLKSNAFGFTISWATNASVVVQACADLTCPVWTPLQTNALTNGSCCFSEAIQTNSPGRFYRISSQ